MGLIIKVIQGTHLKGTTIFPMNGWRSHPVTTPVTLREPGREDLKKSTVCRGFWNGKNVGSHGKKLQVTGSYCLWSRNLANQFLSYKVLDLPGDAEFIPSTESVIVSRRESFALTIDNVIIDKVQYLATDNIMNHETTQQKAST